MSNSFVTIIVDKNERKINLKPKNRLTSKTNYYKASQAKEKKTKKQSEINWIKSKKTKIRLEQVLSQCGTKEKSGIIFYKTMFSEAGIGNVL